MKLSASDMVLKLLGLLLLTAAVFKGYELLTVPAVGSDIWSNRYFLIFTVEFELALGIWLLSGVFKRIAWLAAVVCFGIFCAVTLYKALAGYGSCGCFGKVHVNPWITLFALDLPAVILLFVVKPKNICNVFATAVSGIYKGFFSGKLRKIIPHPVSRRLILTGSLTILLVITSSITLAVNKPATATSTYEVLEPETWIGKELPILEHIDIADQISKGNWLLLFYHHNCSDCQRAIVELEQMAKDLRGNENMLQFALIEIPPYKQSNMGDTEYLKPGRLEAGKEWLVTTPALLLIHNSETLKCWQQRLPPLQELSISVRSKNQVAIQNKSRYI